MAQELRMLLSAFDSINFTYHSKVFIEFPTEERLAIWDCTSPIRREGNLPNLDDHLVLVVEFPFGRDDIVALQARLRAKLNPAGVFLTIPDHFQG